jgi:hypothetical protein
MTKRDKQSGPTFNQIYEAGGRPVQNEFSVKINTNEQTLIRTAIGLAIFGIFYYGGFYKILHSTHKPGAQNPVETYTVKKVTPQTALGILTEELGDKEKAKKKQKELQKSRRRPKS